MIIINKSLVSIITITKNNLAGLKITISSLEKLKYKPLEVIIKDGGSNDGTFEYIESIKKNKKIKNLIYINSIDKGIYNAMNIAKANASGELIHYLNAGDEVYGEPYDLPNNNNPVIIQVKMSDPSKNIYWMDYIKLYGFGYCHQGIIFPKNHYDYNEQYKIAADFEVILKQFPYGLNELNKINSGGSVYNICGISSIKSFDNKKEIITILIRNKKYYLLFMIIPSIIIHSVIPRKIKRFLISLIK